MEGGDFALSDLAAPANAFPAFRMSHGSENRVRQAHLTIRFSADERAQVDECAGRAGLTPGSYVRGLALGAPAPRAVRRGPVERKELVRLLGELGKIGSNLNQIAKALNTGIVVYETEIAAAQRAVLEMRDAVMQALGREP